jgi:hypothetical protein
MLKNVGSADRILRIAAAIVVAVLIITGVLTGAAAVIFGIIAAVLLLTGFAGFCPLYYILKLTTRRKEQKV